jgi:hypothetical protein
VTTEDSDKRQSEHCDGLQNDLDNVTLEEICHICEGKGGWGKGRTCEHCGGVGWIPTEFGDKVLILICHNLKLMFPRSTGC